MKNLTSLQFAWIVLFVASTVYFIYTGIENGFSWGIIAQLLIILLVGPSLFYNKPKKQPQGMEEQKKDNKKAWIAIGITLLLAILLNLYNRFFQLQGMIDNLIGGLILSFLVFLIVHFYLKNKKEDKDNYDGLNDGSGGQHS